MPLSTFVVGVPYANWVPLVTPTGSPAGEIQIEVTKQAGAAGGYASGGSVTMAVPCRLN